jgi:DNA invertase Pin-like site-specific DNA recombinase
MPPPMSRDYDPPPAWIASDSATNLQREAFTRLQAAIFAGKVTTVVVWKLDRLARNLKEGVNVLADWCKRGVRVIAITQQIGVTT